ncbi:hypothetical protein P7C73_g1472, partial [Tremellales sp. Uapishka_1]
MVDGDFTLQCSLLKLLLGCSNLGGVYGNQVFRANDKPLYRRAWAAVLSLAAIWVAFTIGQILQYGLSNRRKEKIWNAMTPEEQEVYIETSSHDTITNRLDERYAL